MIRNFQLEINTNISNKYKITKNIVVSSAQRYKTMLLANNAEKLVKNTNQLSF